MRLHRHLTVLTMTTALVATTAASAWAQDTTSKETGVNLSGEAQPFDITSHIRAMHGMTVVNHKGQPLGTLHDVVIDFADKEVLYALMSAEPGQRKGEEQAEGEQQEVGEASGQQKTAETESEGEQGQMATGALYPIPIEAIEILDRSVLESQMAKAQQTAEGQQQTAEGEQQTAEGEQQAAEGEQQTAEAQEQTAEGEQQTAEAQEQTAESQEQPQSLAEMTVGEVVGMTVVSRDGESIADIEAIVQGSDQAVAVLGVGGFLGIGEKAVGVRLDQFTLNQEGDALVLAATREDLDNAPEVEYESEQTVPEDTRVAVLMDSGQQGQSEQQAQSGQQEETKQQDQAEQQDQAKEQDQTAAAKTEAEGKASSWTAEEITTLEGKVLMVSISKEALQQAPSFEQGNLPDVTDADWQKSVLAFYQEILKTEGADPAVDAGGESTEGKTTE